MMLPLLAVIRDQNPILPSLPAGRAETLKRGDYRGWMREYGTCLLLMLNPQPVNHDSFRLMRASFMMTHRVPAG